MYKLLIVDDSTIQVESVKNYVDWSLYGVTDIITASDGEEGFRAFCEFKPDIIITDIVMPKMNGIELSNKVKAINPDVQIIFMSCYADFNYIKEAFDNNAISYILKPVNAKDLNDSICKILDKKEIDKWYSNMEKILEESSYTFCENILYRLLYSNTLDRDYLKQTIINLSLDKYNVFAIAKTMINTKLPDYSVYSFFNSIKQHVFTGLTHYPIIESDDVCTVVFMGTDNTDFYDGLINQLQKFLDYESHDNIMFSTVLTPVFHSLDYSKSMSDKASFALENYLFTNTDIYLCDDKSMPHYEYDLLNIKDSLIALIDDTDEKDATEIIDMYFTNIHLLTYAQKRTLFISITAVFQIILAERNLINDVTSELVSKMWQYSASAHNASDIRNQLTDNINSILKYVRKSEFSKHNKIISDIKESIKQNYASCSTIEQLLNGIDISVSYAKNIFKKYTGTTISQFLLDKRMSEAKALLSDPYIKIYEIAEKVGYKNVRHFSETFKKYFGKTPTEYQNTNNTGEL